MKKNTYIIEEIEDFLPAHVFECGQCFRWNRQPDGSFTGIASGRVVSVRFEPEPEREPGRTLEPASRQTRQRIFEPDLQKAFCEEAQPQRKGRLVIDNCTEEDYRHFWCHYLDLERNYKEIKETLKQDDPVMARAIEFGWGIRILNQDLWETIVSFIISQNNNIPRIKGCIENLAVLCGEKIPGETYGGRQWYNLPDPQRLARMSVSDLQPAKLGYRAKYLIETAKTVCEKGLPSDQEELAQLCGVGPKVCSCIALFGMGLMDSFPVDVWVARVMNRLYGLDEKDRAGISDFAKEKFGGLGGFAQQYLFYYMRENSR